MATEEQCSIYREKIAEKQEQATNRLCKKMDKIIEGMGKLSGGLIENNTNTSFILERQKEQIKRTNDHDVVVTDYKKFKAIVYTGFILANIVIPFTLTLLGYIYTRDIMTEYRVVEIVRTAIKLEHANE